MDNTDELIQRIDEYLDWVKLFEKDNKKSNNQVVTEYTDYVKHLISSHKVEKLMNSIYEDGGDNPPEIDKEIMTFIKYVNKMGLQEKNPVNQMILLSMKSLILGSVFTDDESLQSQLVKTSKSLKKFMK